MLFSADIGFKITQKCTLHSLCRTDRNKKTMKQIGPVAVEKNAKKCENKTVIGRSLNLA